ncbi:MAG: hypothetical protein ACYTEQ_09780 [Planctomycetota bacterium]|jgi:hypothetical protein
MKEEKLDKLLNELAERTAEPVRPELAEEIKEHIPSQVTPHRKGIDTINIMIDLRVSKLAAAAAIILTMFLLANFFGNGNSPGTGLYQDSKLLLRYCFKGKDQHREDILAGISRLREYLVKQGNEVVFYGDTADLADSNSVLMHWRVSKGTYRVIFSDLREVEVSADELVELQARMLQKKHE